MRKGLLWAVVAVVAVVAIAAAGLSLPIGQRVADKLSELVSGAKPVGSPVPIATADLGGAGPGTLMSAMTMPSFRRHANGGAIQAARVVYHSTNGDSGKETVVSGSVFAPGGGPPNRRLADRLVRPRHHWHRQGVRPIPVRFTARSR